MKKFGILHSTYFKLFNQIKGNSTKDCDFFKFIISVGATTVVTPP
jgi:hypothetical protein